VSRQTDQQRKPILSLLLRLFGGTRKREDVATRLFKRILVIRQHDQLGDMLCVVPLLRALRKRYPGAYIALITSPVNNDVMLENPYIDRVILYDKKEFLGEGKLHLLRFVRFLRNLRREKFELAIVPATVSVSSTSDLLALLSGARYRIGPRSLGGRENTWGALYNYPVELNWEHTPHRHQTLRHLDIVHDLWLGATDYSSEIGLTDAERESARRYLKEKRIEEKKFVVFHPGAGKIPNRWPVARFAQLATTIAKERGLSVLITQGPMDAEPVSAMSSLLPVSHVIAEGMKIRDVAAILSLARLVISNDTGIMHVAAAVGAPVLSFFGPTDPQQWAPIGTRHRYLLATDGQIDNIGIEEAMRSVVEMLQSEITTATMS
jgi:heptosyltransferase-2